MSMSLAGAGAIQEMMPIGGVLHMITTDSIHEVKLADAIDPKRTNPAVPNTQRRVLEFGSDSPIVCKTLLTAKELFAPKFQRDGIDLDRATKRTFQALIELSAMKTIVDQLATDISKAIPVTGLKVDPTRSVAIPQVGGVQRRFNEFIQKADRALQELFRICELFYGPVSGRWFEGLLAIVKAKIGPGAGFAIFLAQVLPFFQFVRKVRNAVEHPSHYKHVEVQDFHIDEKPALWPPVVTVVLPGEAPVTSPMLDVLRQILEQLVDLFETTIAYLAEAGIRTHSGLQHRLLDLPLEQRRYPSVRYCYGVELNGQISRIG